VPLDLNTLGGHEFEDLTERLLLSMGFATEGRKPSADGGVDIVAISTQPLISGRYIVQCKRFNHPVSSPIIRDLYGVVMSERANKGILITTSAFTSDAIEFARDKPIELIDGNELFSLLEKYSLLSSTEPGLSPSQNASLLLRNEIVGLADKFYKQLAQAESHLMLNRKSFGNEFQMSTYKSFEDWTNQVHRRMTEELEGIKVVSEELVQFKNSASLEPVEARRFRTQLQELFDHMLSLYDDVRRTLVPAVASNYEKALTGMIRAGIIHFIEYIKSLEEDAAGTGEVASYVPSTQGSEEVKKAVEETKAGILRVFHGRGSGHRIRKLQGGRFACSCGLLLPNRDEAVAHTSTKYLGELNEAWHQLK
jgi:hypothetical protein